MFKSESLLVFYNVNLCWGLLLRSLFVFISLFLNFFIYLNSKALSGVAGKVVYR